MGRRRDNGTLQDPCLDKVRPGEPIFVLRAQDRLAPALVQLWSQLAQMRGCPDEKVGEALDLAMEMEVWANQNGGKWPD